MQAIYRMAACCVMLAAAGMTVQYLLPGGSPKKCAQTVLGIWYLCGMLNCLKDLLAGFVQGTL